MCRHRVSVCVIICITLSLQVTQAETVRRRWTVVRRRRVRMVHVRMTTVWSATHVAVIAASQDKGNIHTAGKTKQML